MKPSISVYWLWLQVWKLFSSINNYSWFIFWDERTVQHSICRTCLKQARENCYQIKSVLKKIPVSIEIRVRWNNFTYCTTLKGAGSRVKFLCLLIINCWPRSWKRSCLYDVTVWQWMQFCNKFKETWKHNIEITFAEPLLLWKINKY
jgi:hypothetical protein